jgi:hypothetical protein
VLIIIQEYEELSEVIHAAIDSVPTNAVPTSLINKLHLVLAHSKETQHQALLASFLEHGDNHNQQHSRDDKLIGAAFKQDSHKGALTFKVTSTVGAPPQMCTF